MKLLHTSDLHLGKRVNEFSMIEDQKYILDEILTLVDKEKPDGFIIAGDVYDKSIPSAEAVMLFDGFLTELSARVGHIFIIGGNHDSQERLSFASRLLSSSGIHISECFSGEPERVTLTDRFGEVEVRLLPFIKPVTVRRFFPDLEIESYTDAVRAALSGLSSEDGVRRILVTHQFVTGSLRSESEEISVGGSDNVDASVFSGFDYIALGHIHSPQSCGAEHIRYSGTPLKYSFSEVKDVKSVTAVELFEKGRVEIRQLPLTPMRDMVDLRGSYSEVMALDFYKDTTYKTDYVRVTLTDEEDIPDAMGRLRSVYTNIMDLKYDNVRTRAASLLLDDAPTVEKTPLQLFAELYEKQNGKSLSARQEEFVGELIAEIWEGR